MRKSWMGRLAVVATVGLLLACGGSDDLNDERRAQQPMENTPEAVNATVALEGCLETASGADRFVLRNVRFESIGDEVPGRGLTAERIPGITEGAWVRLDASGQPGILNDYLGRQVAITGLVSDSGRNTIGTAGTEGFRTASGDKSEAASDESYPEKIEDEAGRIARQSMANGTAAEVRVTAVRPTGQACVSELVPQVK